MNLLLVQCVLFGVLVGIASGSLLWGFAASVLGHVIYAAIRCAND